MEAIISAAETGFTGSLIRRLSSCSCRVSTPPPLRLTMFLVSMPRQQSRALLQWEPPHWYLRPSASWIRTFRDVTSSSTEGAAVCGKLL
uniref:Uncharacterized protein n=1 Tax=Sparus aurata TaxID=8175 RepID=A0A671WIM6_SPAAU